MSQIPPANPYSQYQPVNEPQGSTGGGPMRALTKVLFIVFIVFGVAGIGGGCLGMGQSIAAIAVSSSVNVDPTGDEGPAAEGENKELEDFNAAKEQMKQIQNAFPGAAIIGLLIQFVSFLLSIGMAVGGAVGLQQKKFGLNLVRNISGFMIPFKIVESGFGLAITYLTMGTLKEMMVQQMEKDQAAAANDFGQYFEIFLYVGIGFGVLYSLVLIGFYLFSFLHTSKAEVRAKFI